MKKIRIAQIGVNENSHGPDVMNTLRAHGDLFEVVGYALPENERERLPGKLTCFEGLSEMTVEEILADKSIEAVTVETDEIYLSKYALMAAKAGKHIHMEKPGGRELGDFEELIETVKKSGAVLHLGYMYRYNPFVIDLMERIRAGELGEIISVEAQMNCIHQPGVRQWLSALPGGMMFFLGCHLIDLVLRLQGEPTRIFPFNKRTGVYDLPAKDFSMALLEYERGVSFIKTTQAEHGGFLRRQLVITGTKGKINVLPIEINAGYPMQRTEYTVCMSKDWNAEGERFSPEPFHRYRDMMRSFAAMATGEQENPYTLDYELTLFRTLLACCE